MEYQQHTSPFQLVVTCVTDAHREWTKHWSNIRIRNEARTGWVGHESLRTEDSRRKLTLITKLNGSVKEPNMFHIYETEKIPLEASDAAENLQLYRVVRFFRPRLLCRTIDAFNVILWTSADICVVHNDLGWKNRTTPCNTFSRAGCCRLEYVDIRSVY